MMMAIQITNKEEKGTHISSACTSSIEDSQYSEDSKNRRPGAQISLHIRKQKFQASMNEKINKAH